MIQKVCDKGGYGKGDFASVSHRQEIGGSIVVMGKFG
jgi:hypothetical protein